MIKIIKRVELIDTPKEVICFYCKSILSYQKEDILPTPFPDDLRELDTILCPVCNNHTPIGKYDYSVTATKKRVDYDPFETDKKAIHETWKDHMDGIGG